MYGILPLNEIAVFGSKGKELEIGIPKSFGSFGTKLEFLCPLLLLT